MDLRRYEVATVAAARELRSSYCALAHGEILAAEHIGEPAVRALVGEATGAEPDPVDAAIARLAAKVAGAAAEIRESDYDELRDLGLADDEILDVVLATAARCFFSTVLEATGTLADPVFTDRVPPALRAALTVGRPISPA
jgi:alkylhydroperoxidase family enzyme